jgi:hypothetical protein
VLITGIRVRTLFPYEGQRDVDLSFNENMVVVAHPAKDPSSPWWYGLLVDGGQKGWFPHDYVSEMKREPTNLPAEFPADPKTSKPRRCTRMPVPRQKNSPLRKATSSSS